MVVVYFIVDYVKQAKQNINKIGIINAGITKGITVI